MAIPVPSMVKQYAREDIDRAVELVRDRLEMDIQVNNLSFETDLADDELKTNGGDYNSALRVFVTAELHSGEDYSDVTMYEWEYFIADDDVFFSGIADMADGIENQIIEDGYIATSITASSILGADEFDDEGPDDGFHDQLDDMADNIEDMQDTLDDVVEDDPSIALDNNITNHYIAECEKCHGVFISAVTESDQDVQSVTGTCPLCGKESEQLLRWIIREANQDAFDDVVVNEDAL